jgi:hypothetical protein
MDSNRLDQTELTENLAEGLLMRSDTVFGRLVCSASPSPQWQAAHLKMFSLWLDLPLSEQRMDLRRYLSSAEKCGCLSEARQHCEVPADLVPASASPHEGELFLRDLRLVTDSMANDGCQLDIRFAEPGIWSALSQWVPKWPAPASRTHTLRP